MLKRVAPYPETQKKEELESHTVSTSGNLIFTVWKSNGGGMVKPKQEEVVWMPERPEVRKRLLMLQDVIQACEFLAEFELPAAGKMQLKREFKGKNITITFESRGSRR